MILKFRNSFLYLIALVILTSSTEVCPSGGKYEEGKLYRHKLDNGLTVLTIERHIAPLIYHQLTYKVGARNEVLGITGMSHVVEHMMFKGTPRYGKGEVSKTISANSGVFNAFTSNDMTSYYEYLPKNTIEIAMDIESDRMMNSTFNEEEFKSEIEVIIQERRMRSESGASGIMSESMNSVAYTSHPNRDPIIGWPNDLRNMTREEAFKYYKTYYTPNNAFLVLIGDFDTDDILKKVKKYYGKIPTGPEVKDRIVFEEPQKVRKTFTLHHSDITQPGMRMAFHAPLYTDQDAAALRVAGMILCEKSRDARLHKRLVEKDRIASSVAGGYGMAKDPVLFQISASVKPDSSVDKVEQIIWEEIKRMQTEAVEDRELQKIKNRYRYNQVTNYIKNADIGSRVSRYEAFFGYEFLEQFEEKINNVTKEDIIRVMNKYFGPEKVTIGYQYPKEGEKSHC
jgi:zinc protease